MRNVDFFLNSFLSWILLFGVQVYCLLSTEQQLILFEG